MERKCELCPARAALFCEADQAYVCWQCDSKVHGANFLVARHHRAVLCQRCSSPSLLRGSGAGFHPTTCLCRSCQSGPPSTGSENLCDENSTQSDVLSFASSSIQKSKRRDVADITAEHETGICSTVWQGRDKSRANLSNKRENCSFEGGHAAEYRLGSPVSVISRSGRTLAKKRRTVAGECASVESRSGSTLEDSSDDAHSRETDDSTQPLELAFKRTKAPLFPKISRRSQRLIRKRNKMRVQLPFKSPLNTRDQLQLSSLAEARTVRVFWNWLNYMNLRSPVTVSLALHLFRKCSCIIEVSDVSRVHARIILACCLWIAIKFHNPNIAESSSTLYEECTGIRMRTLLAVGRRIFHVLNSRTVHGSYKDEMP